jgi:hypothetical protein
MIAETIQAALTAANIEAFQLEAAQNQTPPFVVFGVSTEPVQTKDGVALYSSALTVYCAEKTIGDAVAAGNAVLIALFPVNSPTVGIRFARRETTAEGDEGSPSIYIETVQFTIKHQQP